MSDVQPDVPPRKHKPYGTMHEDSFGDIIVKLLVVLVIMVLLVWWARR